MCRKWTPTFKHWLSVCFLTALWSTASRGDNPEAYASLWESNLRKSANNAGSEPPQPGLSFVLHPAEADANVPRPRHLPFHRLQVWAHDMSELSGLVVGDIVGEMRAIPDDHVGAVYRLPGEPGIEASLVRWTDRDDAVVDFRAVVPQNPNIAAWEGPIRHCGR